MDLKQEYVLQKQSQYLNRLIDIGVAGFRIDAAKHIYPEDLEVLWNRLNPLNTQWFQGNSKPYIYNEVIDMDQNGEIENGWYSHLGPVTEFRFCVKVSNVRIKNNINLLKSAKHDAHIITYLKSFITSVFLHSLCNVKSCLN